MDVYGSPGIARVGAGVAAWITLAFWTARRSPRIPVAVAAAAAFLLAWLCAYYTTDGLQQGVPLSTMWPLAKIWVVLLAPGAVFIGFAAWRSRRSGVWGDAALALPLGWSLTEACLAATRMPNTGDWLLADLLLLGLAAALVTNVRQQRSVNVIVLALATLASLALFALAATIWFWLRRP